jgi:hypothetical protein
MTLLKKTWSYYTFVLKLSQTLILYLLNFQNLYHLLVIYLNFIVYFHITFHKIKLDCFYQKIFTTHEIQYGGSYTISCNIPGLNNDDYYWIRTTQNTNILWSNGSFLNILDSFAYSVVS